MAPWWPYALIVSAFFVSFFWAKEGGNVVVDMFLSAASIVGVMTIGCAMVVAAMEQGYLTYPTLLSFAIGIACIIATGYVFGFPRKKAWFPFVIILNLAFGSALIVRFYQFL